MRKEIAELAADAAREAAKEQAEKHGGRLPPEALRVIREQVYGLVDPPVAA